MSRPESSQTASSAVAGSDDPAANVGKIRDILFGGQMREYEGRFAKIEQRLFDELSQLREELTGRVSHIEHDLRQESRKLGEANLRERSERLEALHAQDLGMARLGEDLLSRVSALDRLTTQSLDNLRQQIEDTLTQRFVEMADQMQSIEQRVDGAKTGRQELAGMLADIAARLNASAS